MTREEAIIHLGYLKDFKTPAQIEALDMAIKALEQPEQRWIPCSDMQVIAQGDTLRI